MASCRFIVLGFVFNQSPERPFVPHLRVGLSLWLSGSGVSLFEGTVSRNNVFLPLKHRQVLLEIFSKNYRVRRNMIQSRLTQECGEDLSKQEVDKVLKVWPCPRLGKGPVCRGLALSTPGAPPSRSGVCGLPVPTL